MRADRLALARRVPGFMPDGEGLALHRAALRAAAVGPLLEVGSWCGKSAVYLGDAAARTGTILFCVDHHRGSEENQAGWEHHDPSVVDPRTSRIDTLPTFRRTIEDAGLEATVVAVVGESTVVAAHWHTRLGMVFIDGGHGAGPAHADYDGWAPLVAPGGLLAIHDVFEDPAAGGRPPFDIWSRAVASGAFTAIPEAGAGSLRILQRTGDGC
ncbi:MAG TPA: class I SAM-dependent methyltransferase [Acidimicrobiales bacterium]|nr:class I SAM-dependent methyltransferase [Acidimicrobiales bacterium]